MVQFLKDPVFNTSLIVGYYWIPLCVLVVLYGNIFHAAWTLSQKSREKEKEREKLLALSKKPSGQPAASNPAVGIAVVAAMTYQGLDSIEFQQDVQQGFSTEYITLSSTKCSVESPVEQSVEIQLN